MKGLTFDAGGLIALDRGDRRVVLLLYGVLERGERITIPGAALAQAMRNPARQARLSRLIRQSDTDVCPLDAASATAAGVLLSQTGTSDIADAHVVLCARQAEQAIVTSDAQDLRRLAPELKLVAV